ncbi:unnamed protein product, partial [Choristocarpus tenellus]
MMLVWAQPEITLPEAVTKNATHFTGVELFHGHGRMNSGGLPNHAHTPAPFHSHQDRSAPPPNLPPPGWWAAGPGRPGFLFEISPQMFDECLGKLLFGLPRRLPPGAKEIIAPGVALFLWDPSNGLIFGIFRATSPLTEGIDRQAWANRPGQDTPFPWQVRVAVDLEAPPVQAGDPAVLGVFQGGPVTPGGLDPERAHKLASLIASRLLPPPGFMGPGTMPGGPGPPGAGPGPHGGTVGPGRPGG